MTKSLVWIQIWVGRRWKERKWNDPFLSKYDPSTIGKIWREITLYSSSLTFHYLLLLHLPFLIMYPNTPIE